MAKSHWLKDFVINPFKDLTITGCKLEHWKKDSQTIIRKFVRAEYAHKYAWSI